MFSLALRSILFKMSNIFVTFGHNRFCLNIRNSFLRKGNILIGVNSGIDRDFDCLVLGSSITIGEHSVIGIKNKFWNYGPIEIGSFCMFAGEVSLTTGGHDKDTFVPYSSKLVVGNGVWVGHGANIVARQNGLHVGDNAIVAAGALVISDVPAGAIVAGVPAKVIGYRKLPEKVWHLGDIWFSPYTFEVVD